MFCFQCQETAKNTGCTVKGVCGKPEETANLQDLLIFVMKGISVYGEKLKELGAADRTHDEFIAQGLFATITNANWDDARFIGLIQEGLQRRAQIKAKFLSVHKEKPGRITTGRCLRLPPGKPPARPRSLKRPRPWACLPLQTRMYVLCANF
jgi:hydroxylamine reductase